MFSCAVLPPPRLRQDAVPSQAVPLGRFTDPAAVADLVTVLAAESTGYRDDIPGAVLALFESAVDAVLLGGDLRSGLLTLDTGLRLTGVWATGAGGPLACVDREHRTEQAVHRIARAFAPFVAGRRPALLALAAARVQVVTAQVAVTGRHRTDAG